jgi:hypothetical protein
MPGVARFYGTLQKLEVGEVSVDLAFIKGEGWDIGLDFFGKIVKIDNINQHFWALGWERLRRRWARRPRGPS